MSVRFRPTSHKGSTLTPLTPLSFADQRILVTGGRGFLGTHVCDHLRERGVPEDRLLAPAHADYELTDPDEVRRLFEEFRPDVVVHLAAEVGGIAANQANPGQFFYRNFAMGLHLIEASRAFGVQKFVHCGTVCAYPEQATLPLTEDQFWHGYPSPVTAPYGVAKMALTVMLDSYRQQYGLKSAVVIPVNLYGPHDDFDLHNAHVVPALIRKIVEAKERGEPTVTLWGTGRATRDFLYVTDAAAGVVAAADRLDTPDPVNLASGVETPVAELARVIAEEVGFTGSLVWDSSQPDGQIRRQLSVERAAQALDWHAEVDLAEGIAKTVAWYRTARRPMASQPA